MTDNTTMASVKTTISLPKALYDRIEKYRKAERLSRSEALAHAAEAFFDGLDESAVRRQLKAFYDDPAIQREQRAMAELGSAAFKEMLKDNPW